MVITLGSAMVIQKLSEWKTGPRWVARSVRSEESRRPWHTPAGIDRSPHAAVVWEPPLGRRGSRLISVGTEVSHRSAALPVLDPEPLRPPGPQF